MMILLGLSLLLSGVGLFLSSWIVMPAPTLMLLPLGVGAPEISPLLLLGNGIVCGLALLVRHRGWWAYGAIGCSVAGIVLSSLPLLQLPGTIQRADAQMQAALGFDYQPFRSQQQLPLRPHPVSGVDLVRGIPLPTPSTAWQIDRPTVAAADGTPLMLEIHHPTTPGLYPTIVTIYGGAWQRGEPSDHQPFKTYMAAQGYTLVAIDYRHAPGDRFPAQVEDVQRMLQWVAEKGMTYGVDSTRVALMGWSAGAHLALLAAYQAPEQNRSLSIRAVVNYYGPTNLTEGYRQPPVPDPIHTRSVLEAFLGGSPDQLPEVYQAASPLTHVRPNLPPTLSIYGDRDHLVKPIFGQQLADQLRSTHNRTVLITLPWAEHAFDAVFQGLGNQIALYYTERFLAWALHA